MSVVLAVCLYALFIRYHRKRNQKVCLVAWAVLVNLGLGPALISSSVGIPCQI